MNNKPCCPPAAIRQVFVKAIYGRGVDPKWIELLLQIEIARRKKMPWYEKVYVELLVKYKNISFWMRNLPRRTLIFLLTGR